MAVEGIGGGSRHMVTMASAPLSGGPFCKGMGLSNEDIEKPVIGICNTWSELNSCHRHLREVAEAVKRGVWQAGGLPLEFPTISLGETFLSPTACCSETSWPWIPRR